MSTLVERARAIKFFIMDVDGVLTDATLACNKEEVYSKNLNVYDGLGLQLLKASGIELGIITGCATGIIQHRATKLGIKYVAHDSSNKLEPYEQWRQLLHLSHEECAYIGDDLPDLPVMRRVGLAITVPHAPSILKHYANYVTQTAGGHGAVREVCELIMTAQGTWEHAVATYLT